jgi:hypothetical protein
VPRLEPLLPLLLMLSPFRHIEVAWSMLKWSGVGVGGDDGVWGGHSSPSSFHRRNLTVTNHLVDSKKKVKKTHTPRHRRC